MAIDVDWAGADPTNPYRIYVPRADLTLIQVSPEVRQLDLDAFRLALKDLEAGTGDPQAPGMPFPDTHDHAGERVLSGITYARFVEILAPYSVEFEDGQYAVSVVGGNSNLLDVKVSNQVSLLGNNSAGLVNLNNILSILNYAGYVWVDTINGVAGTIVGTNGTPTNPVSNLADALTLCASLGIRSIRVLNGALTLAADLEDFEVVLNYGASLDFNGFSAMGTEFRGGIITGVLGMGPILARNTHLNNLSGVTGECIGCILQGTLSLGAGNTTLSQCQSGVVGVSMPALDLVGPGRTASVRGYIGGLSIVNMTDSSNIASLDIHSGQLIIDASCVAGELVARGLFGPFLDFSAGTTVVNLGRIPIEDITFTRKLLQNRLEVDFLAQQLILYDDDGITVLQRWTISTDGGESVATATGVQTKRNPV